MGAFDVRQREADDYSRVIMENVERLIDKRLQHHEDQDNKKFAFRKKGNEAQFELNFKLERRLQNVDKHLATVREISSDRAVSTVAKRARDELHEALGELEHRNKMLKLADISQGGWTTVSEYQTHKHADNSDDE
jgi:hypothetical protein